MKPSFWGELFFLNALKMFLLALWSCSRYVEGVFNVFLCAGKRIMNVRYSFNATLTRFGATWNGKFSTWAPLPTWKFYLRTAPGSPTVSSSSISVFKFYYQLQSSNSFKFYLQLQSSNSIFDFSLQILSSTSIFALLSPDCHFKFIKLVEKVHH